MLCICILGSLILIYPRMDGSAISRARHYLNLNKTGREVGQAPARTSLQFGPICEVDPSRKPRMP